ncbi:hypothetical protein G6O69_22275 [Pseudenhygromyxa sp. WMMC2535]|uniref:hypothetical protein n=1 Tax=Pseudenhygromyxa sp. WMMC2535 TaxID=2712867 RepID=UPI001556E916|nr:hypothetical protein [Pseudenhygromyxa sp. WMMC2535]NVB40584.1 hypothetical protein [Pseudenhygromyxa sp. WMMC2535]
MAKNDFYPSSSTVMDTHQGARVPVGALVQSQLGGSETLPRELPDDLQRWLVGLRLLEHVPFHYIVPDARMLPPESARFFYIDRTWTDRLVDGAFAAGAISNGELELARDVAAAARSRLDADTVPKGEYITGMLLRSTLVRRWPRMEIRAHKLANPRLGTPNAANRRRNLRISRISESILLVLWHGVPNYLALEEPKHGVQYGVNDEAGRRYVEPRSLATGEALEDVEINVQYRSGKAEGVLDISALASQLTTELGTTADSRHVSLALQQMPFIQPFRTSSSNHYPDDPPQSNTLMWQQIAVAVPRIAAAIEHDLVVSPVLGAQVDVTQAVAAAIDEGMQFLTAQLNEENS